MSDHKVLPLLGIYASLLETRLCIIIPHPSPEIREISALTASHCELMGLWRHPVGDVDSIFAVRPVVEFLYVTLLRRTTCS